MSRQAPRFSRRQTVFGLGAVAAGFASVGAPARLLAQTSDKLVRFILPVSPGSGVDGITRAAQTALAKALGRPVVIENQPGAGGLVGTAAMIKSASWLNSKGQYDVYISALVEEEISGGDPTAAAQRLKAVANIPSVATTVEAQALADVLLTSKAVPINSARDALHIAIAATQGVEYLLTWNFKHINNAETRALILRVVEENGWVCPVLCSPEELGGNDYAE